MNRFTRTVISIMGTLLLLFCMSFSVHAETGNPATRIILDKEGNAVTIPANVKRVAPQIGAMAHMTSLLGCADKIVCAADANLNDYFRKIFPGYVQANPRGLSTGNVEDVIASGTQVVYGSVRDDSVIAKYRAAGIAVVPLNTFSTVEEMKDNIRKIAEILGGDAPLKAERFCDYYDAKIRYVSERTANLPENKRVRILSLAFRGGSLSTINSTDICSVYMTAAGGNNVAAKLEKVRGISAEDIIRWDPEVIITFDSSARKQILKEPVLQVVTAVKTNKVYIVPYGTYLWSVRSAEGAMMPLWLAKTMHPDIFPDLDMADVIKEYYSIFYGYNITDNEIEMVLKGRQS